MIPEHYQRQLRSIYDSVDLGKKYRLIIRSFYRNIKPVNCVIFNKTQHSELMYSLFCVYEDGTGGYEWIHPNYENVIDRNVIGIERIDI